MSLGTCRLCGKTRELQRSHFLPAAFYSMARKASLTGESPVVLMGTTMVMTDREARTPLLCSDCEESFNKRGENWVIKHCWRSQSDFPLLERLRAAEAFTLEPGFASFQAATIPDVDVAQLVYFAASVFWRAAVQDWRIGDATFQRLKFGPYEERLRAFLNGESEFPPNAALLCTLTDDQGSLNNQFSRLPWKSNYLATHRGFEFFVPGMSFKIFFGAGLPSDIKRIATAPAGFIFVAEDIDRLNLDAMTRAVASSTRHGKLAKLWPNRLKA
jgi:hypothetical protein